MSFFPKPLAAFILFACLPTVNLHAQTDHYWNFEKINTATGAPDGWQLIAQPGTVVTIDSNVVQDGKHALLLEKNAGAKSWAQAYSFVKPGIERKKLILTGYIKTENIKDGYAALWVRINDGRQTLVLDEMNNRGITGTTGWKQYTLELDYPFMEATAIYIGGMLSGSGKMWIDNLHLTFKDLPGAQTDTVFNNGSGISNIVPDKNTLTNLTNLGMLWGFLKYHHPAIAKGNYNWDAELFRVLPKVLSAKNRATGNAVMEAWTDALGKPDTCKTCKEIKKDSNTKMLPDYGNLFMAGNFSPAFIDKLAFIKDNRHQRGHYYIEQVAGSGKPEFTHEQPYSNMRYPDAGYRLLALYRYWNIIQYFFPYKYLIGEDWNKVLTEFIPHFVEAKDSTAYHLACLQLISRIHDSHANLSSRALSAWQGNYFTPVLASFVENKLVVVHIHADSTAMQTLQKGDVIARIDGIAVEDLARKWLPQIPGSNIDWQLLQMPGYLLRGKTGSTELQIIRQGKTSRVTLKRYPTPEYNKIYNYTSRADSSFKLINNSIGYIFPGRYRNTQLPAIKKLFENTKGIVIDMRCYPSDMIPYSLGEYIKPAKTPFVQFALVSPANPGLLQGGVLISNGNTKGDYYKGKVIVIVNAVTRSQAEYATMALQGPNVTVIGSTTAAADGSVTGIVFPGNLSTVITGVGVYYPDGSETQRVGVKIDIPVKPTIQGIREGRDELLEKAIEIIERGSTQ
jgi:hypothetical protein